MSIFDNLFPAHCAFCGKLTHEQSGICKDCALKLPFVEGDICIKCGRKVTDCDCKGKSNYFTAFAAPLYYNDCSKSGILRIKNYRKFSGINTIARLVTATVHDRFEDIGFDCMTVVPMTYREQNLRGFNQAEILGRIIAKNLDIEFNPRILSKIYDTKPQKILKSFERTGNVSGVFHISDPNTVRGKTILLFDDIITTGATLNECAKMLLIYGASEVYACSALLTVTKKRKSEDSYSEIT